MRKLLVVLVFCLGSFVVGCSVLDTAAQRTRRVNQTTDLQMRMLMDDWDYIWLYDRTSALSQWHSHVGT